MAYTKDVSLVTLLMAKNYTERYVKDHQGTPATATEGTLTIGTTWSGDDPFTQSVTTTYTATDKTVVDIMPDPDIVSQLQADGVSQIIIQNDNGGLTAYAFGAKPSTSLTIQVLYSEVI